MELFKKCLSSLLALILLVSPVSAFAAFESLESLIKNLGDAHIENIIEMPANGGLLTADPNIKVYVNHDGKMQAQSIRGYSQGKIVRLQELDYMKYGGQVSLRAVIDKTVMEAFQVGEIFLCYREPLNVVQAALNQKNHNTYAACYIFPMKISDVVNSLRVAQKL